MRLLAPEAILHRAPSGWMKYRLWTGSSSLTKGGSARCIHTSVNRSRDSRHC